MEFESFADMYHAVSSGKADYATVYLDNYGEIDNTYDNLALLYEPLNRFEYSFAAQKNDKDAKLCSEYDKFIEKIQANGEYDKIISKWEDSKNSNPQLNDYHYSGEKGKLKIATIGTWKPKTFYIGETLCGTFIELTCYFCQENGYIPDFHVVSYSAEITGITSGEYDFVADAICQTQTRLESVNMTGTVCKSTIGMITQADTVETTATSKAEHFISSLKKSFEKTFLRENRWKMLLSGLYITILLALLSGLFGSALGCIICAMLAPVELLKKSRQEAYDKAMKLLETVGLSDKAFSYPSELSGGQQQRAAIVRALAMDPEVILFDEPTSALDPTMVSEVQMVIRNLAQKGLTMLIVTHEMKFARSISSRIFYMDEGEVYEEGTPEQIFEHPKREKTRQFIHRLKIFNWHIDSSFSFISMNNEINHYAISHMISPRLLHKMLRASEELCVQTILPMIGNNPDIDLCFEYSEENESIQMSVTYSGNPFNPLTEGDPLAMTLVKNTCENLTYKYNGKNRIYAVIS